MRKHTKKWFLDNGYQPCEVLAKLKGKQVIAIMPATNPSGTRTRTPKGWTWVPGWTKSYGCDFSLTSRRKRHKRHR
jgi:hypothetical protein